MIGPFFLLCVAARLIACGAFLPAAARLAFRAGGVASGRLGRGSAHRGPRQPRRHPHFAKFTLARELRFAKHRIERRKIHNRGVVIGCDHVIRADSLRLIHLPLQNPRDHSRPAFLRSEYRRPTDVSYSTHDYNPLARFDYRS